MKQLEQRLTSGGQSNQMSSLFLLSCIHAVSIHVEALTEAYMN